MIDPRDALERLRVGNLRYVEGRTEAHAIDLETRRRNLLDGQQPFAAIFGCADSRVPVEQLFDQGPGSLFVVRVAGNVPATEVIGSLEYAVEFLGVRLLVVLGHSQCGAVTAALDAIDHPEWAIPGSIGALVGRIRPCVESLPEIGGSSSREQVLARAIRANACSAAAELRADPHLLAPKVLSDELLVLAAEYDLETGTVDFVEGAPGD